MLMLGRKAGESILIGDDLEIVITKVMGNNVRVGIQAPKNVKIVRKELVKHDLPASTQ